MPLLVARQAEWDALGSLAPGDGPVLPLLMLPPPTDGAGPVDPVDLVRAFLRNAGWHWGGRPLLIDGHDRGRADLPPIVREVYREVADWSQTVGAVPLPVLSLQDGDDVLQSAAHLTSLFGAGAGIRLNTPDLALVAGGAAPRLGCRIDRLLTSLRLTPADVELVVDLGQLTTIEDPDRQAAGLQHSLAGLPHLCEWRSVVLAGTSAPTCLDDRFNAPPVADPLPRREWQIWRALKNRALPRHPDFGDYAGFAATPATNRGFTRHPSLRYSTADGEQLIVRRRSAPGEGFRAFADICRDVTGSPYYLGADFSWGDRQIQNRSAPGANPGNARTWREIAVNHHIATVLHQLDIEASLDSGAHAEATRTWTSDGGSLSSGDSDPPSDIHAR